FSALVEPPGCFRLRQAPVEAARRSARADQCSDLQADHRADHAERMDFEDLDEISGRWLPGQVAGPGPVGAGGPQVAARPDRNPPELRVTVLYDSGQPSFSIKRTGVPKAWYRVPFVRPDQFARDQVDKIVVALQFHRNRRHKRLLLKSERVHPR